MSHQLESPREPITEARLAKLRRIPFFKELPDDVLSHIANHLKREQYYKDQDIFAQDEDGDAMYLIESGQVAIINVTPTGEEHVLVYHGPGSFFGEMALLLDQQRSATARVTLDAEVLILYKDDLNQLLGEFPTIALSLSRELSRRLSFTNRNPVVTKVYDLSALIADDVIPLAESLAQQTQGNVLILRLTNRGVKPDHPNITTMEAPPDLTPDNLAALLSAKVEEYNWVLVHLSPRPDDLSLKAIELADITIVLGAARPAWQAVLVSRKHWQIKLGDNVIASLARRMARRQVGLALSSGAARGLAHIGVLKVLQEAQIPIDMMAGTSAGALFGGFYATGMSIERLIDFATRLQNKWKFTDGLWDIELPPRHGFLRGDRVKNFLRQFIGNVSFADLKIPMHIVATDAISGEEVVFSEGVLVDAIRASMSIVGLFHPAQVGGRYLIDGAATTPIPAHILTERGADIIIASSVIPSLEDRLQRKSLKHEGRLPSILGLVIGMQEIMESEIIKTRTNPAHIMICPAVETYSTTDFVHAVDCIKLGEAAAHHMLDQIKQALTPTPRPRA